MGDNVFDSNLKATKQNRQMWLHKMKVFAQQRKQQGRDKTDKGPQHTYLKWKHAREHHAHGKWLDTTKNQGNANSHHSELPASHPLEWLLSQMKDNMFLWIQSKENLRITAGSVIVQTVWETPWPSLNKLKQNYHDQVHAQKKWSKVCWRNTCSHVHCSSFHKSQTMKSTYISI